MVERTPLSLCLLDNARKIFIASQEYVALAQRNEGTIPAVGDVWKSPPKSVELKRADGEPVRYAIESLPLPEDGAELVVLLREAER